ncbi:hypothetical protein [Hymenobacter ruricola]|uniref:Lipoprotein n=1 Tax=Hymenobacter ruricola TaxID=2791023 RepID=A0ABS0IBN9_9BACT|nr:hypothetical protein [Hymenobacter ruricola]MBF9224347.1 hypothetical protein [Hymenobacter ruricola]
MKPYLTLALAATLLAPACKKDDPDDGLPPATQEGKNTGGCLVNGERFVATGYGSGLGRISALSGGFAFDSLYYLELSGVVKGNNVDVLLFFRSRKPGTYPLNRNTLYYPQGDPLTIFSHATYTESNNTGELYVTDAQHTGQVEFTYADVARRISAGTFEFTAASTFDRSKTVTVTSGRFDRQQ